MKQLNASTNVIKGPQYGLLWDSKFNLHTFRSLISKLYIFLSLILMTTVNQLSHIKKYMHCILSMILTRYTHFLQCPGGAFTPDIQTTKEFPDDVVTFVRNHPVMFNPIYPVGRRPLVVRTNADYKYTSVAVDQVIAADGNYQVLFLGTGMNVDRSCRF